MVDRERHLDAIGGDATLAESRAGVVDQHVNLRVPALDLGREATYSALISKISDQPVNGAAASRVKREGASDVRALRCVSSDDDDGMAATNQLPRCRQP